MEIAKTYNSSQAEQTWYQYWLDNKCEKMIETVQLFYDEC